MRLKTFRFFGFHLIRYTPILSNTGQVVKKIHSNSIDRIFEIKANIGQFTMEIYI
jgi:hypothetical protein